MNKLFAVFCIALALSTVSSQSCSSTASLRSAFGLTNNIATAATASGVNYCKSIKTGALCCSADQMNGFQTKTEGAITALTNAAASKDQAYKAIGNGNSQAALTTAVTNLNNAINAIVAPAAGALDAATLATMTSILQGTLYTAIGFNPNNVSVALANIYQNVSDGLTAYQQARSTCAIELIKTQGAAWCLSCDPNAETKGYNSTLNTLTISNAVCNRLKTACYEYIANGNLQNSALQVAPLISYIQGAADAISGVTSATAATALTNLNASSYYSSASQVQTGYLPPGCTSSANCDWICTSLFASGNISSTGFVAGGFPATAATNVQGSLLSLGAVDALYGFNFLNLGGLLSGDDNSGRRLGELKVVVGPPEEGVEFLSIDRKLYDAGSGATFDPSDDEAGTTVTFSNDPAGVNTGSGSGSGKSAVRSYGSVLAVVAVAVCSMML